MVRPAGRVEVRVMPAAERDLKSLTKKYPHVLDDLTPTFQQLESDPHLGEAMAGFGAFRKIRVRSSDMQRGKRGGFRVITKPKLEENVVEVWMIYAVSEAGDPGTTEIRKEIARRMA